MTGWVSIDACVSSHAGSVAYGKVVFGEVLGSGEASEGWRKVSATGGLDELPSLNVLRSGYVRFINSPNAIVRS